MAQTTRSPPVRPAQDEETEEQRKVRDAEEQAQARANAEAATAHLAKPGEPPQAPLSPQEAAPDEPTVTMIFPTPITLTLPGYRMVYFPAGIQEVPVSMADDPYLESSGVTPARR